MRHSYSSQKWEQLQIYKIICIFTRKLHFLHIGLWNNCVSLLNIRMPHVFVNLILIRNHGTLLRRRIFGGGNALYWKHNLFYLRELYVSIVNTLSYKYRNERTIASQITNRTITLLRSKRLTYFNTIWQTKPLF